MTDSEAGVAVGDGGAVGEDFDICRLRIYGDGDGVALEVGFDGQVAQELYWEYPGLELAVLRAYDHALFAGYGEGVCGLGGAGDGQLGFS